MDVDAGGAAITVKRPGSAFHDRVATSKNARQRMSKVVVIARFSPGASRALTNRLALLGPRNARFIVGNIELHDGRAFAVSDVGHFDRGFDRFARSDGPGGEGQPAEPELRVGKAEAERE